MHRFLALDASGKSAAHLHHRQFRKARAGKPTAGFFILRRYYPQESFKLSSLFHCIFANLLTVRKTFDTSGKSPAHLHHRENRAGLGRRNLRRAFLLKFWRRTTAARMLNENNITGKRDEDYLRDARVTAEPSVKHQGRFRCEDIVQAKRWLSSDIAFKSIDYVPVLFQSPRSEICDERAGKN